ncbi:MAG: phosphoribosylanthranilate isomerase [Candidatus Omnitrophota bacterium]|nr:phosphoribosylanthranilate isomerase [Candidatus Omnitrophota bacterium]
MMVKVKICGITNLEDAMAAVDAGCDALGFIFSKSSPRYITPKKAGEIIKRLARPVIKIGVFVNAKEKHIKRVARSLGLNMLQFHGGESAQFCRKFKNYKIIKTFKLPVGTGFKPVPTKNSLDLQSMLQYRPFAYLFDTYSPSKAGGTGKQFNWKLLRHIDALERPVFLSGGLRAGNVLRAIKSVRPDWVDASSSLESSPGKKDHRKVRKFIEAAKRAEY